MNSIKRIEKNVSKGHPSKWVTQKNKTHNTDKRVRYFGPKS